MQHASYIPPWRRWQRHHHHCWLTMCMLQWFRSRRFPLEREVGRHWAPVRPVNGVRAGSSPCRVCARMPKRKGHSKRESQGGRGRGSFFFLPCLHICTPWDSRPSLYRSWEARDWRRKESPRRCIRGTVYSGCIDASFRVGEKEISTRSWKITARLALKRNIFWRVLALAS